MDFYNRFIKLCNEKGIKPESLSSTNGADKPVALDFATAVGEGSLTRFDKKKNKNKKNKKSPLCEGFFFFILL